MKAIIQNLVETTAPSGYEGPVRKVIAEIISPLADDIRVDALGNLIARKGNIQPGGLRIMLSAHMDEIGLIATHIDDKGFVRFQPLGGVGSLTCQGGRVRFLNGPGGVISSERLEDTQKIPPLERFYIDLGVSRREDCPVKVGDVAAFERPFLDLGKRIVSKAMDDRIGVAVLIECLRQLSALETQSRTADGLIRDAFSRHELYFVFSTQEEVGLRGATVSAYGLDPDLGLSVDVTASGDTPKGLIMEIELGKGPAIKIRDGGMLSDPRVVRWMVEGSEQAGIPYQREILLGGTTDARAMQLARAGVPAGCLSIPCRYIHSPSEMVDYDDVQNGVRLLVELLSKPVELGSL